MRKFKRRVILKNYIFIYLVIIFIEVFYSIDKIGLMISPKMINIIKNNISYYDNILIEEYLDTKELRDSYIEELITIDKNSKEEIVNIDINTSKSYILLNKIVNNLKNSNSTYRDMYAKNKKNYIVLRYPIGLISNNILILALL